MSGQDKNEETSWGEEKKREFLRLLPLNPVGSEVCGRMKAYRVDDGAYNEFLFTSHPDLGMTPAQYLEPLLPHQRKEVEEEIERFHVVLGRFLLAWREKHPVFAPEQSRDQRSRSTTR